MAWRKPERFINSLSFQHLQNTVELDLSGIFGRGQFPTKKEIHEFISDEMKVKAEMLRGIQHHPRFPKVHLQLETGQQADQVENLVKDGLVMKNKNLRIYGHRCDTPSVNIVLCGQDMSIEKDEVERVMAKYGTVVTCERGRNADLSTKDKFVTDGTWQMRLKPKPRTKPPETIYYFGSSGAVETWILSYEGVTSSCVLCGEIGHMGFRCNATVNKTGIGKRPAGMGKWTDIAACKPVVPTVEEAQGPLDEAGDGPVAGPPVQQGGGAGGADQGAGTQVQEVMDAFHNFLPASQEVRRIADLDSRAREAGWGKVVGLQPQQPQQSQQQQEIVAVEVLAREDDEVVVMPRKRRRSRKKKKVAEKGKIDTPNRSENSSEESEEGLVE